jgi:hypothetical protein
MLAASFGVLEVFWLMLWFFVFILWIMLLFRVFADIFRSSDLGGFAKVLWLVFVILTPYLGVFVYLIARGGKMAQRDMADVQANEEAFRTYVRSAAGSDSPTAELARLADLKEKGAITDAEFATMKAKIIG